MATHIRMGMTALLKTGEPAPWFFAPVLGGSARYHFDPSAGRYVLMLFYGSAARPQCRAALDLVQANRHLFDDDNACFFGITVDRADEREGRIAPSLPGVRHFLDYDRAISRSFGAMFPSSEGEVHRPRWVLLDPMLRVVEQRLLDEGDAIIRRLKQLLEPGLPDLPAPVMIVPNVFGRSLCRRLIDLYGGGDPADSGYMVERDGRTVPVIGHAHKRRSDLSIDDSKLREHIRGRLVHALVPMIQRAYQFEVTRIERWIVACYDGEVRGHFRPHRDNTTSGTAHRRFACSINLNSEEYEGGALRFPEFGPRTYKPPTGGAVIFSCSLLHEATPVTQGRRFAFLPFFYDEEAALVREANNHLTENGGDYRADRRAQSTAAPEPEVPEAA